MLDDITVLDLVSIHAPARGATLFLVGYAANQKRFRSTPPRGGRPFDSSGLPSRLLFRSTPPRGGRPAIFDRVPRGGLFRSTPPRGGRQRRLVASYALRSVSIHAPARGATMAAMDLRKRLRFRSTPPRGGRLAAFKLSHNFLGSFDPRPREGGDGDHGALHCCPASFDPRPREGGDLTL